MEQDDSRFEGAAPADDHLIQSRAPFLPNPLPEPEPAKPAEPAQPGYADLLITIAFALLSLGVCVVLGGVGVEVVKRVTGIPISMADAPTQLVMMLVIQGVWWAVVMAFLYYVLVIKYGIAFGDGLHWLPAGRTLHYLAGGFAMAIAVTALANILPMPDEPSPMEALLEEATRFLPLFVAFGVLIAPAIEEVVFRGFVYGILERAHGTTAAIIATAALFAAPHSAQYGGRWQILLLLFLVGVVLGIVRARTGSTLATTYLHAAYNATFMLALIASQIAPEPVDV